MASPTRFPASKSIWLVWILNIFILGLGNVYASGLSALRWLIIGVLIRVFVHHPGVLLGAYVLLSLIGMGEIIAGSAPPSKAQGEKSTRELRSKFTNQTPKAINAPPESLISTFKVRHEQQPENLEQITDDFVRKHLVKDEPAAVNTEQISPQAYEDLHAGQLTHDAFAARHTPYSFDTPAIEPLSIPQPLNYEFPEYKFDTLDYQSVGSTPISTLPSTQGNAFTCPHCGTSVQHDFSFCLSCGHAYAIG